MNEKKTPKKLADGECISRSLLIISIFAIVSGRGTALQRCLLGCGLFSLVVMYAAKGNYIMLRLAEQKKLCIRIESAAHQKYGLIQENIHQLH